MLKFEHLNICPNIPLKHKSPTPRDKSGGKILFMNKLVYKPTNNAQRNKERLKFQDFNIYPNILYVDADADADADDDADAGGIAIALLH